MIKNQEINQVKKRKEKIIMNKRYNNINFWFFILF